MDKINIQKVAVIGSGIMGSRIACHLINVGLDVLLLDIVPKELNELEKKQGKKLTDKTVKNRIVKNSLNDAVVSKPSPLFSLDLKSKIKTGNLDDDINKVSGVDWIIEVVVEKLHIKKIVYDLIEKHRKKHTIITTNTSGIPINHISKGRSKNFKEMFCGTHFFNPPRYLRLLEIIPGKETNKNIISFFKNFGSVVLGKETVECKDTPAFIANRLGIYSIMSSIHSVEEMELRIAEVDVLTGTLIGRPKSATFRTMDVVGLDTAVNVANNLQKDLKEDESVFKFKLPSIVEKLYKKNFWGDKTKQGFYKKTINEKRKKEILEINPQTLDYITIEKTKSPLIKEAKKIDNLKERLQFLINSKDKYGFFYRKTFYDSFRYCSLRIPEVSDDIYKIDSAICAGFGWKLGPFETWDALGVKTTTELMIKNNQKPATWVLEMLNSGINKFYRYTGSQKEYYDIKNKKYSKIPGTEGLVLLEAFKKNNIVWSNKGSTLYDIGDGVLNLEFHTKMNTMGEDVLIGINRAISICEKDFAGLIIGNEADVFSAGANLGELFMMAGNRDFDKIDYGIAAFQNTVMNIRYSSIPVVAATSGLTLGGGCELSLHADKIQAHNETYMGLVEMGVGLIPSGCGTKEVVLRISENYKKGDPELNALMDGFMKIAQGKVSTSAVEAKSLGYIKKSDKLTANRKNLLKDAKNTILNMLTYGYVTPKRKNNIKVHGRTSIAMFNAGIETMKQGSYISDYDQFLAKKLAYIISGGDLTQETLVTEQYLLDLERETQISLLGEPKTLERMHSILFKRKPLRN